MLHPALALGSGRVLVAEQVDEQRRFQGPHARPLVTQRVALAELLVEQGTCLEAGATLPDATRLARSRDTSLFFERQDVAEPLGDLYDARGRQPERPATGWRRAPRRDRGDAAWATGMTREWRGLR